MTTFILSGPQAIGKTRNKDRLAAALKASIVIDDCTTCPDDATGNQLAITNTAISPPRGGVMFLVEDEAGLDALVNLLEQQVC